MSAFEVDSTRGLDTSQTEEEFRKIDEEIQELHAQIRTLLTRRNRLTGHRKGEQTSVSLGFAETGGNLHLTFQSCGVLLISRRWVLYKRRWNVQKVCPFPSNFLVSAKIPRHSSLLSNLSIGSSRCNSQACEKSDVLGLHFRLYGDRLRYSRALY
ncbi:hypothetical protein BDN72DRAFT_841789, partial [Pluteus cervinus]